jgi:hypothetical protein
MLKNLSLAEENTEDRLDFEWIAASTVHLNTTLDNFHDLLVEHHRFRAQVQPRGANARQ